MFDVAAIERVESFADDAYYPTTLTVLGCGRLSRGAGSVHGETLGMRHGCGRVLPRVPRCPARPLSSTPGASTVFRFVFGLLRSTVAATVATASAFRGVTPLACAAFGSSITSPAGFSMRTIDTCSHSFAQPIRAYTSNAQCPETRRGLSRCVAVVVVQQSAETRATGDRAGGLVLVGGRGRHHDEVAVEALVKSLRHVVTHVLLDHIPKMPLAKEDEVVEALVFDRLHEAFRVRIAVWTLGGVVAGPLPEGEIHL